MRKRSTKKQLALEVAESEKLAQKALKGTAGKSKAVPLKVDQNGMRSGAGTRAGTN